MNHCPGPRVRVLEAEGGPAGPHCLLWGISHLTLFVPTLDKRKLKHREVGGLLQVTQLGGEPRPALAAPGPEWALAVP